MTQSSLTRILAAGRTQFNQRVVEARRRHPALDTTVFGEFLMSTVAPLVEAVALTNASRAPAAAMAGFDFALELTGLNLVGAGARSRWVGAAWAELAPALAHLIASCPADVLGLVSNAVIHVESIPGARPGQWLAEMTAAAAGLTSVPELQAAGQVVAWRSGVAHFRLGAIEAADLLPDSVAARLMGAEGMAWGALKAQLLADPWWTPAARAAGGVEFGAFTGLGGQFPEPPAVSPHPDGFSVRCGGRYYLLVADAWGAVLHASTAGEFDVDALQAHPDQFSLRGATLRIGTRDIAIDLPAEGLSGWCNGHTVALTSPYTHAIRLYPAR